MKKVYISNARQWLIKHEPECLTGTGLVGFTLTSIELIRATSKSVKQIEQYSNNKKLTRKEIIKMCWKNYIPAALYFIGSSVCVIASNRISAKRSVALATTCALTESAFNEYRNQTRNALGNEKEKQIAQETNKKIEEQTGSKEIILSDDSKHLFKEPITGVYFQSTWNDICKAINQLNSNALNDDGVVSVNSYLEELGLSDTLGGYDNGWRVAGGRLLEGYLNSCIAPNNKPCLTYDFNIKLCDIKNR